MNGVYIIAEAGVNHNGDIRLALKMADEAKKAGVDAIKFQTYQTEKIVTKYSLLADYQRENCGNEIGQFGMLKSLELSYESFRRIKEYCDSINLEFLSTPDEESSLLFLVNELGLEKIKVGSAEVNNIPYLRLIGSQKKHVILSTGMATMEEIETAVNELETKGATGIDLLHCTMDYPANIDEVNLKAMQTMKYAFNRKVGYSDHTLGYEIAIAAVALGAEIIEKHFTLDKNMSGPDHNASLDYRELKNMVTSIRNVEVAMGTGLKAPTVTELQNLIIVRKSIVAKKKILEGEKFSLENLTLKRPGNGISPAQWDTVLGKSAKRIFEEDEQIEL